MNTPHLLIVATLVASAPPSIASTIAYWDFNTLAIGSASLPGTGDAPTTISADSGSGTIDLSGWTGTVDDFAGSAINSQGAVPAGASLSLIAGSGLTGNGGTIILTFSMSGWSNPVLSYATQGSGTGFISNQLAWSLNGSDYTDFGSSYAPASSYGLQSFDLSGIDPLDGAANVWLRLTFDGASGSSGNNRIDNVTLNAIPEPGVLTLLCTAAITATLRRRRGNRELNT